MGEVTKKKLQRLNEILNSVDIDEVDVDKSGVPLLSELQSRDSEIRNRLHQKIDSLGSDGQAWMNDRIDDITRKSEQKIQEITKQFDDLKNKYIEQVKSIAVKNAELIASKFAPGIATMAKSVKELIDAANKISDDIEKNITSKIIDAKIDVQIFIDKQLVNIIKAEVPKKKDD